MPRNSSGTYTAPPSTSAVSGAVISSTAYNSLTGDLGSEITNSVDRLGRSAMQANLPMAGFLINSLGTPVASTDGATKGYVDTTTVTLSGLGTGVQTALGQAVNGTGALSLTTNVSLTSPTLVTPVLGTATATKITYAAGTATVAPIVLTSGTNLTTPAVGALEYDGNVFYATHTASNRGLIDVEQYTITDANKVFVSNTLAQAIFASTGGLTAGAITVPTGTHLIEMVLPMTGLPSGGAHTLSLVFGGTATVSAYSGSAIDVQALTANPITSATTVVTNSTQASAYWLVSAVLRISGAGTIIPQAQQGGNLAAFTLLAGATMRVKHLGASATNNVGNWS